MKAKELLKKAKLGDVILFKTGMTGLVIEGFYVKEQSVVDDKAIVLINYPHRRYYGCLAWGCLDEEAKIVKKANCIIIGDVEKTLSDKSSIYEGEGEGRTYEHNDVKEHLKEFMDWFEKDVDRNIGIMDIKDKAKEIFGEELI